MKPSALIILPILAAALLFPPKPAEAQGGGHKRFLTHLYKAKSHYDAGQYRQALKGFKKALMHRRLPVLYFWVADCHDKLGRRGQALSYYNLYLQAAPKGPRADDAQDRIRFLSAGARGRSPAPAPSPRADRLLQWARRTRFKTVRRFRPNQAVSTVLFNRSKAKLRKAPFRLYITYLRQNKWIMVYTTILHKVERNKVPTRLLLRILNFNSNVPGSKLSLDKRYGNLDVQYEIPTRFASPAFLDEMVLDVALTADHLHDQLLRLSRATAKPAAPHPTRARPARARPAFREGDLTF